MIILMRFGATEAQVEQVCEVIRRFGLDPLKLPGEERVAVGIPGVVQPDQREDLEGTLAALEGVSKVTQTSRPYKLASLEFNQKHTTIDVKGVKIGPGTFTVFAGPCSVESLDQFRACAEVVKAAGVKILRGGAFKPRTSPYAFQGLQLEGLKIIKEVADEFGLVSVSEVMSADMVQPMSEYVDILQIGARSMQNFPLLIEAGKSKKPIFFKRGPAATIDEYLLAAEYMLNQGNASVMLCERGILPIDRSYVRNTFDINAIPVLKECSHLPVIADPSHGIGVARYVPAMAKAAMIAGADGVMVEMHPNPAEAMSDGSQSLTPAQLETLIGDFRKLAPLAGRTIEA